MFLERCHAQDLQKLQDVSATVKQVCLACLHRKTMEK